MGGDLNRFRDIKPKFTIYGHGGHLPDPKMVPPLIAPYHKEQKYIWFMGGDLNRSQDIKHFTIIRAWRPSYECFHCS